MIWEFWLVNPTTMPERSEKQWRSSKPNHLWTGIKALKWPRSFSSYFPAEAPTASPGTSRELVRSIGLALSDSSPSWLGHMTSTSIMWPTELTLRVNSVALKTVERLHRNVGSPDETSSLWGNFTSINKNIKIEKTCQMTEYIDIALNDLVFSLCFLMFPQYLTLTSTTFTKTACIALLNPKFKISVISVILTAN